MNNSKFEVTIKANGKYSGESVELIVKSEKQKKCNIEIPAGTLFYPEDENQQTLVLVEKKLLVYNNKRKKYVLDGFCTEANDGVPKPEKSFTVNDNQNIELEKLIDYLSAYKLEKHNIQEAIWCVTDGESLSNIVLDNSEESRRFMTFISELTGQDIPWYSTRREFVVGEVEDDSFDASLRRIIRNPIKVSGEISFSTTKKSIVKSKIIDEGGNLVFDNEKSFTVPRAIKNVKLDFNLNVKGWESGVYYVVYFIEDGTELLRQKFEV